MDEIRYTNPEYDIASTITETSIGYRVALIDTDVGMELPTIRFFKQLDQAKQYALTLIN